MSISSIAIVSVVTYKITLGIVTCLHTSGYRFIDSIFVALSDFCSRLTLFYSTLMIFTIKAYI